MHLNDATSDPIERPWAWLAGAALGFFGLGYAAATDLATLIGSLPLACMVIVPCLLEATRLQRDARERQSSARRISRNLDTLHRIT